MTGLLQQRIAAISAWVDGSPRNQRRDAEALLWSRVTKVCAEAGEVVDALSGYSGENPRKGQTHTLEDVRYELLDTALAALAAVVHIYPGVDPLLLLHAHATHVWRRAGLDPTMEDRPMQTNNLDAD